MSEAGTGQTSLGKYEIRGKLGRGAMGLVLDGWDPVIGRRVAIKTVPLMNASDPEVQESLARFKREAQAAGRLSHPNIVGVYDYGETDTSAYIVMEFVPGQSLKERLDTGERFSVAETVRMMEQMLAALQFSHDHGVVHRDIKTANVMLTQEGQVKLADFGVARIEGSTMTQDGSIIGTPAYMSPEQLMGQHADARSDIYAAGVVLYQLLAGERPFDGSLASITHKVLNSVPPRPSEIALAAPPELDAVVARAMGRRPHERYATANAFALALMEAYRSLSGGGASAPPPRAPADDATAIVAPSRQAAPERPASRAAAPAATPTAAPAAPPRGRGGLLAGVAAVVVLLAAGGGWYFWPHPPTPPPPPNHDAGGQAGPNVAGPSSGGQTGTDVAGPSSGGQTGPAVAGPSSGGQTGPTVAVPSSGGQTGPTVAGPSSGGQTGPAVAGPSSGGQTGPTVAGPSSGGQTGPTVAGPSSGGQTGPAVAGPSSGGQTPPSEPGPQHQQQVATATPGIDTAALRARLADVSGAVSCAIPQFGVTQAGDIRVSGPVGAGSADAALRSAVKGAAPATARVAWDAKAVPSAYCGMLDLLRPLIAGPETLALFLHGDLTELHDQDLIQPDLRVDFPAYIQVDYLSSDGSVAHMFPTRNSPDRPVDPGVTVSVDQLAKGRWGAGTPFGTDMMVAVASSVPLFAPRRLEADDKIRAYVPALQAAIEAARRKDARVVAQIFVLKTLPK
jgi:Protein kinase domain/Domain of unknown function (DUF4384)